MDAVELSEIGWTIDGLTALADQLLQARSEVAGADAADPALSRAA
jgi:hypothetical protein